MSANRATCRFCNTLRRCAAAIFMLLTASCFCVRLCRVTGLTLSKEQLAEATARVAAAGLSDKVTLLFCDYRCGW